MNEFAQNLIAGVLNSLPAGIALAVLTAVMFRLMRRTSASARFVVWFAALAGLPLLAFLHSSMAKVSAVHADDGISVPTSLAIPVFAVWAVIAGGITARVVLGISRIWKIRRSCVPVAKEELPGSVLQLLSSSSRAIEVCTSPLIQVPAAVGLYKPAVVLPEWALKDLSSDQLSVIICHELAHLRRWDDWSNLAQKLLRAVLFFHPAVWWIERKLSLEREMACDDAALAHAASARDYAASLVAVAEKSVIKRSMLMAQAAVHHARETSLRIARLLSLKGQGKPQTWKPVLVLGVLAASVVVIEPGMPRLIAFQDQSSAIAAGNVPVAPATKLVTEAQALRAEPLVTPATFTENRPARVLPAKLKTGMQKPALRPAVRSNQPEMLVIFQNASFDQQGMPTWNVYVLRVKLTENLHPRSPEPSKRT